MDRANHRLLLFPALPLLLTVSAAVRCHAAECVPGTITTVAGGGTSGPATEMCIYAPSDVAIGSDGLYIIDSGNHVIRKLGLDRMITTVAGDGWTDGDLSGRCAGDGGPALRASFDWPDSVVMGPDGSLYIAEDNNHRVRKITPAGIIVAFAGTGDEGYSGDNGPAVKAMLDSPSHVAIDKDGNVYISDSGNHRVRMVDPGGTITTFAGDGRRHPDPGFSHEGLWEGDGGPAAAASLSGPAGLAFGPDGSLYIAETWNRCIRKIDPAGIVTSVVGPVWRRDVRDGPPAARLLLDYPQDVAVDPQGNLYIVDDHRVLKVDRNGMVATFAGTDKRGFSGDGGPAAQAQLYEPRAVAVGADGIVYIADMVNCRVRAVDRNGIITTIAGNGHATYAGDNVPATTAVLRYPKGIAVGPDGTIYVADTGNHRIRKVDPAGVITTIAGEGGEQCWFEPDVDWMDAFRQMGLGDGGPALAACLHDPKGIAIGPGGSLYIPDLDENRVRKIDPAGVITTVAGGVSEGFGGDGGAATRASLEWPYDVAVGRNGSIYIADRNNHRIRKIDPGGIITTVAGSDLKGGYAGDGGPAAKARLNYPHGLGLGPDGSIYIADTENHRIRKVDPAGVITTIAGTGELGFDGDGRPATAAKLRTPYDVEVAHDGTVYIADTLNNRVRRVSPEGIITTLAGTGRADYSGDGGPATEAGLYWPASLAVGPDGNLYIADRSSSRIRKVCLAPTSLP